jgi:hypothetical protein
MLDVHIGGVMRCCLHSLAEYVEAGGTEEENTVVPCKYCKDSMVAAWMRIGPRTRLVWMKNRSKEPTDA